MDKTTRQTAAEEGLSVVVVGHRPLFVKTPDEKEQYYNVPVEKRKELLGMLGQSSVVAMLTGHTHRMVINKFEGIQLVSAETTSKNFDGRPLGYRLWRTSGTGTLEHEFKPLI